MYAKGVSILKEALVGKFLQEFYKIMLPNITVIEVLIILLNLPLLKKKGYTLYVYFSKDFSKHSLAAVLTSGKRAYYWLKLV